MENWLWICPVCSVRRDLSLVAVIAHFWLGADVKHPLLICPLSGVKPTSLTQMAEVRF